MNKSKSSIRKIGKYLRELSIVVVGIAITISIGVWINNRNNEKDLKLYLDAVKLEMEQNIEDIDELMETMQKSVEYTDYLQTHDKNSINRDSINRFDATYYIIMTSTFKKNAFEMFKLSGTMRLMNDKDLLFSVWDIYTGLDDLATFIDIAHQHKLEEMKKELPMIAAGRTDFIPMITFYTATPWYYEMLRLCKETSEELQTTVEKLEKLK